MKKILSIVMLCIAIFGAGSVSAQARWGVVAGMNLSKLSFDQNLFTVNSKAGASVGVTGELMMPGIGFGVDASLLYTQRGTKLHLGERPIWANQGIGEHTTSLHYLEIPLSLKFKFKNLNGIENTIMPILFVGPEFSFLLAHNKLDALSYSGGEFGIHMGVGCEILRMVQVNASYCWGLSYAVKTKLLDDFSARNRNFRVSATYFF